MLLVHQAVEDACCCRLPRAKPCALLTPFHSPQERRHTLRSFSAYADWVKEVHFSGESF